MFNPQILTLVTVKIVAKRRTVGRNADRDSDAESTGSTCEVGWMSDQVMKKYFIEYLFGGRILNNKWIFLTNSFYRVATCQGKVREKQNFLQVRELSGNFEKMSGNFGHLTNVREMSGNFVMTIKFFQK